MGNKRNTVIVILFIIFLAAVIFHLYLPEVILSSKNIDIDFLMQSAREAYYQGDLEESRDIYRKILKNNNMNENARKNLIIVYKELGQIKKAIDLLDDKNDIQSRYEYGVSLYQLADYDSSIEVLEKILNEITNEEKNDLTKREISYIYYYLGKSHQDKENLDKALSYFKKGASVDPEVTLNYISMAEIYRSKNQFLKAINFYREAVKKDSSLASLYPKIAVLYYEINQFEKSYNYWQRSLSTGIKTEKAQEMVAKLEEKYPEFKKKAEEEKRKERSQIEWKEIKVLKDENIQQLRIGLVDDAANIGFETESEFKIIDKKSGKTLVEGKGREPWQVKYKDGKFTFTSDDKQVKSFKTDTPLVISCKSFVLFDVNFGQGYFWSGVEDRQYRGDFELFPTDKNYFNVINIINLEEYLFSVVPSEVPAWWPQEALKAQSVAARSYAIRNLKKHEKDGYDLCDGVHCAAYKGIGTENSRTTEAVLATRGEVIVYNDRVIEAVFSSNSGGYTESSEDVWGTEVPYLTGVNNMIKQAEEFPLEPYQLRSWLINQPNSYSDLYSGSNTYRWVRQIPVKYFQEKYNLEELKNIVIKERSTGGSIKKVILKGKNKEMTINMDRIRSGLDGLKSNRFIIDRTYKQSGELRSLIFYGSGWGHGVGLDQTAAAGMGDKGFDYQEIITHFYPGTDIKKIE